MIVIRNEAIVDYLRSSYRKEDVRPLLAFLNRHGAFRSNRFDNGLFPAVSLALDDDASGYQNAWVRDNVHIAHAQGWRFTGLKRQQSHESSATTCPQSLQPINT